MLRRIMALVMAGLCVFGSAAAQQATVQQELDRVFRIYSTLGASVAVIENGKITFTDIDYKLNADRNDLGTYVYKVTENTPTQGGLTGDSREYTVIAKVEDDGQGGDPTLRRAIELAVESGKISTSLIQRRMSLGYGRAAKLIDRMEEMGIVSAQDGQKPREVLITKQQFMEMVVNDTLS